MKSKVVGLGAGESKEECILNRVVRVTPQGWQYEADQRHADIIVKSMKMEECKPVSTAGEETKDWQENEDNEPLPRHQEKEYRALAARANYLANDRIDIQYVTKEICRGMSKPLVKHRKMLKRLARYLAGHPRLVSHYEWQEDSPELWGFSDSDWAGCKQTAKSTSGGIVMRGSHLIKAWSSTQKAITLSSGEAELVAAVKMCSEFIGVTQLAADWGCQLAGKLYMDSSAAIGAANRRGSGKMRHVKVGNLWIQQRVEEKEIEVRKVKGESNPADLLTKHVGQAKVQQFTEACRQIRTEGRAAKGLRVAEDIR